MTEELKRILNMLLWTKAAAEGKKTLISNQGQGMDGFTELANYRSLIAELEKLFPEGL